jgi:hypothetical protein
MTIFKITAARAAAVSTARPGAVTTGRAAAAITVAARAAAVIAAAVAIAACAASASRPAATTDAKRAKPATPALSTAKGAKICDDLNSWLTVAWHLPRPRFTAQMESDESAAGYTALGSDLMTLDFNLVNFNAGALRNTPPNHYPVTGLAALEHDCTGYGVSVQVPAGRPA